MNLQQGVVNGIYMRRIVVVGAVVVSASYFIWKFLLKFGRGRSEGEDNRKEETKKELTNSNENAPIRNNENENVPSENVSTNKSPNIENEYVDFEKIKLIYKEMTVFTIDCIMQTIKDLERNKEAINQSQIRAYKENVITSLDGVFERILEKNGLNVTTFMRSLKHYCEVNAQFKLKVSYLSKVRKNFIENEKLTLDFPTQIKENFLKIVTNIFYLTAYATYREFKELIHTDQIKEKNISDRIYQKYLKATRKKVYAFFGIPRLKEVNVKYLVRLYPFSLSAGDPVKEEYLLCSQKINAYLDNLNKKVLSSSFLEMEQNVELSVTDAICDLDSLVKSTSDFQDY